MRSGIPACHVTISLKRDASGIHISFRFIGEKGTSAESEKEQCGLETCHDRKAYRIVRKAHIIIQDGRSRRD